MAKEEQLYHSIGEEIEGAISSQMFGKPCYKINGKAFVCFFKDEMGFKLTGDTHSTALALKDAQLFDPSGKGRAMKEWVQVPYAHKAKWKEFAIVAMEYVNTDK